MQNGRMAQQWFTSDLHLGHRFVASLRGFDTVEEHDAAVLDGLRDTLSAGDTVWMLGDLSCGDTADEDRALDLLADVLTAAGATADLIAGNHDSCHPLHRGAHLRQRRYLEVFRSVQAYQKLRWEGQDVWLSHFPRPGRDHEGMESRYDELRLDVPRLVHGHLHSDAPDTGPGMVDVGVEAWGLRPVAQADVADVVFDRA